MHQLTGDQDAVLEVLRQTIYHLGQDSPRSRQAGIEKFGVARAAQWPTQRDEVIDRFQRA